MWFVGALDAIFRLVAAWKLFDNFENTTSHESTDLWPDGNNVSDLEFVGQHRFLAVPGAYRWWLTLIQLK